MSDEDFNGYHPTALLRWTETKMGEEIPRASIPGWPECGPTHYKLQQLWVSGWDGEEQKWRDVGMGQ